MARPSGSTQFGTERVNPSHVTLNPKSGAAVDPTRATTDNAHSEEEATFRLAAERADERSGMSGIKQVSSQETRQLHLDNSNHLKYKHVNQLSD
jgi:hypothetical protein